MNQLKMDIQQTISTLSRSGWSQRRIARELGIDRETVARYRRLARQTGAPEPAVSPAGSEPIERPNPAIVHVGSEVTTALNKPDEAPANPAIPPAGSEPVAGPNPAIAPPGPEVARAPSGALAEPSN